MISVYSVQFSQRSYQENDESQNCRNYPNMDWKSFYECDQQFVKKSLYTSFGSSYFPIWADNDPKKVTKMLNLMNFNEIASSDLFQGKLEPDCAHPCISTTTDVRLVSRASTQGSASNTTLFLHFLPIVENIQTTVVKFSVAKFLSEIGGTLGLWLGLGFVQLLEMYRTRHFIFCVKKIVSRN